MAQRLGLPCYSWHAAQEASAARCPLLLLLLSTQFVRTSMASICAPQRVLQHELLGLCGCTLCVKLGWSQRGLVIC